MGQSYEKHELLRESPSSVQADVFLSRHHGQPVVVKDFSKRPWLLRVALLRPALRHEYKIMNQVCGVVGVPRLIDMTRDQLVLEFIVSTGNLVGHRNQPVESYPPLFFFQELRRVVTEIHACGVAHGDVRRRNILVTPTGPCLIDFGTGISTQGAFGFLRRALFRRVMVVDNLKVLKLQACYYPESLTVEEQVELAHHPPLHRALRRFKRGFIKRWLSRKRWRERLSGQPQQSLYRDPPVVQVTAEEEEPCKND